MNEVMIQDQIEMQMTVITFAYSSSGQSSSVVMQWSDKHNNEASANNR